MATESSELDSLSSLAELVRGRLDDFSTSERKVARTLLANYPIAGLETVAELAGRANVSPPTVIRFVSRLGFSGHAAFQKALMREVHASLGSPLEQYAKSAQRPSSDRFMAITTHAFTALIGDTFDELPQTEFDAAVTLLCDPRRRILLVGGRFSHILAEYLALHLQLMRSNVTHVPAEEISRLSLISDSSKNDVLVAFDYRRYDPDVVRFSQRMADHSATVVLLTDSGLSPIADVAGVVLPSKVDGPSPFDSLAPAIVIVETLVAAVAERLGDAGRERVQAIEQLRARTGTRP